ncbi:30S ribosomal protein S4, partial [Pseudomonas syringae pv. tagetis]
MGPKCKHARSQGTHLFQKSGHRAIESKSNNQAAQHIHGQRHGR